ncbi:hypothetical protein JMUB4039_1021 [Leptotrichia trevisanii]|nr:hypothetical protein JMUB4039_1021 [Leptotrichia trevisanii]
MSALKEISQSKMIQKSDQKSFIMIFNELPLIFFTLSASFFIIDKKHNKWYNK